MEALSILELPTCANIDVPFRLVLFGGSIGKDLEDGQDSKGPLAMVVAIYKALSFFPSSLEDKPPSVRYVVDEISPLPHVLRPEVGWGLKLEMGESLQILNFEKARKILKDSSFGEGSLGFELGLEIYYAQECTASEAKWTRKNQNHSNLELSHNENFLTLKTTLRITKKRRNSTFLTYFVLFVVRGRPGVRSTALVWRRQELPTTPVLNIDSSVLTRRPGGSIRILLKDPELVEIATLPSTTSTGEECVRVYKRTNVYDVTMPGDSEPLGK
ncbi:hypothetical protein K435DRAFT_795876 [Dendrothele bispora CBS 962.96]|uniref:Uncharacterized protein n=1 Tax=Dendrothele bispora (strain CBS 962.96) TaxID=1314807 RepID=A0A4S8M7T0_DENBC|nr:hypothetical protein K435DRAFT_795876 [Dendrothele bispora CBS 962.96]